MYQRPSSSLNPYDIDIFTSVMRGYYPIPGFQYDFGSAATPINDDPTLEDYNVENIIDTFVDAIYQQNASYPTNHIFIPMGGDFNYAYANTWYKQMDKLIHYTKEDGRINVFYSTPNQYTKAKYELFKDYNWTLKTDDWFPYADQKHAYWTGYFTSRPALKGYIRSLSNYLQFCRHIETTILNNTTTLSSENLWQALSVAQHHDAISGTSKEHVAKDYAKRLYKGYHECKLLIHEKYQQIFQPQQQQQQQDNDILILMIVIIK